VCIMLKYLVTSYGVGTNDVPTIKEEIEGYPHLDGYSIIFTNNSNSFYSKAEIVAIFEKTNVWIKKVEEK
jgi:hypothetical protein